MEEEKKEVAPLIEDAFPNYNDVDAQQPPEVVMDQVMQPVIQQPAPDAEVNDQNYQLLIAPENQPMQNMEAQYDNNVEPEQPIIDDQAVSDAESESLWNVEDDEYDDAPETGDTRPPKQSEVEKKTRFSLSRSLFRHAKADPK